MENRALPHPSTEDRAPISALLGRIQGELLDLGRSADDLQATISQLAAASVGLDAQAQMRLQAADALSQRIERLAQLAKVLTAAAPADWAVDLPPGGDLSHALSRLGAGGAPCDVEAQEIGECELF